jgi:hypothetical protein
MGRIVHNILAMVLLYIVVDMGLAVSYLLGGTCYRHYPVLVSITITVHSGAEAALVVATIVEVLALAGEGPLLLTVALLELLFLVQSVAA